MENGEAPRTIDEIKLTGKQKKFADAYIASLNAVRSAEAAGYTGSYTTLAQIGHRNLRKPAIRAYIDQNIDSTVATKSEVLATLTNHLRGAVGDLLTDDGGIDIKEIKRRGLDSLIKKLEVRETVERKDGEEDRETLTRTYKIELHDAQAAADKLAKVHKLYTQKVEVTGQDGNPLNIMTTVVIEPIASHIEPPPEPDDEDSEDE